MEDRLDHEENVNRKESWWWNVVMVFGVLGWLGFLAFIIWLLI